MSPRLTWLSIVIGGWGRWALRMMAPAPRRPGRFGHRPWVEPSDDVRRPGSGGVELKLGLTL
jgi:hypothetical protein